jgi:anti-anti-sigma factor
MSHVTQSQGVTIIELGASYDSLDERSLEEFGEVLLAEATYADPPRLLLDLSSTAFIGSSFIELLVQAWKRLKHRRGDMALCAPQPFCAEVLRVARLDTIWPIHASRRDALAAMSRSEAVGQTDQAEGRR